jgi:glucose/arabinose dehydrogenase
MKTLQTLLVTPLLALVATSMTMGQAPDCTGISPIFNANADLDGELTTVSVASGLSRPVFVTSPPGDRERLFIVEQDGLIRILENGTLLANEFLDVSGITESPADGCGGNCEQGLLGLTFDPNYETNGYFYIRHTLAGAETEIVARYERDPDSPNQALTNSRVVVITIPSGAANHTGGSIAFSPTDGRLYVGTGDGGNFCNTFQTSQNLQALNGKMLRLDVSSLPYTTTGNPYHGSPTGLDEIWSLGLRNPYRWSFDRVTGNLLIGDVGQNNWEEVDCALDGVSGQNYGWDFHEGNACPPPACGGNTNDCNPADYVAPILQYSLAGSPCSVIGGYVYRGCRMPDLHGTYFYAEFGAANI